MRGAPNPRRGHRALIEMRQQVGNLRRALAAHRSALVALTHPELEALGDYTSSEPFSRCWPLRVDRAGGAGCARGDRRLLRRPDRRGGHRTNEIMKVLTLTSVILLPGALIAGVMGMNFKVGTLRRAAAVLGRARG